MTQKPKEQVSALEVGPVRGIASVEQRAFGLPGVPAFLIIVVMLAGVAAVTGSVAWMALGFVAFFFLVSGFFIVAPNQASVITLFGRYVGTERRNGFFWTNPLTTRRKLSLRIRNFSSQQLKVNDAGGSPIEIAAVVVWRVVDTARASFDVENYEEFVHIQAETALRHLASQYSYDDHHSYDDHQDHQFSLRGNPDEVAAALVTELGTRLEHTGVEILEARLSHLAYAPEIAGAMLQRQQAGAILAARQIIVQGAVGMVEMALAQLSERNIVELDEERKAQMVSNLLVVLTSERGTQPVVNAGSLY
ncbi:SPFH domain-containing protein [Deinococcus radiomollis]|uniref:SPFH domain-containing protein n=1 Tax=Deinococcus radiomollis TaxID=468916 RepID=UPI003892976F